MTARQKSFAEHYIASGGKNATKAAVSAGYSPATATQAASRLKRHSAVMHYMLSLSQQSHSRATHDGLLLTFEVSPCIGIPEPE